MDVLPSIMTRPLVDAYGDALDPGPRQVAFDDPLTTVDSALPDGVPARLALDATRVLVLATAVGVARPLLLADPRTVVVDDELATAPDEQAPLDSPRARLTLVVDERIADSTVVVPHVPIVLGDGTGAAVEVTVDRLRLTCGSLRGPGSFGSRMALRWRDLLTASDHGPAPTRGDPALGLIPRSSR